MIVLLLHSSTLECTKVDTTNIFHHFRFFLLQWAIGEGRRSQKENFIIPCTWRMKRSFQNTKKYCLTPPQLGARASQVLYKKKCNNSLISLWVKKCTAIWTTVVRIWSHSHRKVISEFHVVNLLKPNHFPRFLFTRNIGCSDTEPDYFNNLLIFRNFCEICQHHG